VEAAMAEGKLRAVVATSTLDLGIDWGDVDLVVPCRGSERREPARTTNAARQPPHGRASKGILCRRTASRSGMPRRAPTPTISAQDTPPLRLERSRALQHFWGLAVAEPFDAIALYEEIISAESYRISHGDFRRCVDFVATGGYASGPMSATPKIGGGRTGTEGALGHHIRVSAAISFERRTIVAGEELTVRLGRPRNGVVRGGARTRQNRGIFS